MHSGQSESYNRKMEVRQKRVAERDALFLSKQLYSKYGLAGQKVERIFYTKVRDVILQTRRDSLLVDQPREQPESFFRGLVRELTDGTHGRITTFQRYFVAPQPQV